MREWEVSVSLRGKWFDAASQRKSSAHGEPRPEYQDRCPRKSVVLFKPKICTRFASNSTLSTTFWLFPGWKWKYGDKVVSSCPAIHHIVSLGQNKSIFFFSPCRFRSEPDMPWMFYLNFLEFGLMITYKNICLASLIFIPWNRGNFNGRLVHSHYNIKLKNAAPKWSAWLS